ncbi:MAG TPA: winged helix-turn-helix domain-containing tetratricopeptide repeat protein [Candidatus Binatus sp.]|nr:winged helix-turn-helix domain-containing tetratricopeptide repeat protein [Candidatus Binatus sp.]
MDALASDDLLLFEDFRLDRCHGRLLKHDEDGVWRPVAVGSRALDVLAILADRQGTLLSKEEIMAAVWPNTVVEDNNLSVQIAALRRVLDRDRTDGSCIQTVPGRGYRFVAPVARTDAAAPPVAPPPSGSGVDQRIVAAEQVQDRPGFPAHSDKPPFRASRRRPRRGIVAGVLGILFLVAAGVVGWQLRPSGSDETRQAPRLSIVVLPFVDLSATRVQQYFADGVTEDLTTDLSRIPRTLVISVDTALTYRNKPIDAKQIGRELGVRYVVEGSLERFGNRVRVNAQLIDAETDAHLWADRFDREITDLFALQSEITGRVAFMLNLELVAAEVSRPVEHPDALDYIFRGREFFFGRSPTSENLHNAISLYEQALRLDPQSAEAKTYLAGALVNRVNFGFTSSPAVDLARAEELIDEALAAGTKIPWAHYVKGTVLRRKARWDDAVPEFEAALALNRNMTGPLQGLGWCKLFTGSLDEVIPLAEKANRIGPRDPQIGFRYLMIGEVHELQARPDEAIVWYEKARGTIGATPALWAHLASAHALRGDLSDAAADLAEARRRAPDDRYSTIGRLRTYGPWGVPKVQAMFEATYFAGLRKAGVPEN